MMISTVIGVLLTILGIILISGQFMVSFTIDKIRKMVPLVEGSDNYEAWSSSIRLTFSCYLFNVTNPDGVMQGEHPNLVEYGPFTYNEVFEKQIMDINEETDEIVYTTTSTYSFDKYNSLNVSSKEKVTILNPAYVGTISMLSSLPINFMTTYGNNIQKLFANTSSIFLQATANDILFKGVKVKCNPRKFPELKLICTTLARQPPPVLRTSGEEGIYLLSIFQRINATYRGPFAVKRGVQNISDLGDITMYKGRRVQVIWSDEKCNRVRGTDTITYGPIVKPTPFVTSFIPDYCRSMKANYDRDVVILGMTGSKFTMTEKVWLLNETQCYCPVVNKKAECLPQGLHDASLCQEAPIIISEPHFLHADPELLTYARGLKPDKKRHSTFIIIEPTTGTPLSGSKKMQLNLKLTRQPVKLLSNVTDGYFPLLWCENGNTLQLKVVGSTYQTLRIIKIVRFLQQIPLIVGIYILLISLLLRDGGKVQPTYSVAESILVSSNFEERNSVSRRPPRRALPMFE